MFTVFLLNSMLTLFIIYKEKEHLTGEGCVRVVIPWQLCRSIGPLTLHSQEMGRGLHLLPQEED